MVISSDEMHPISRTQLVEVASTRAGLLVVETEVQVELKGCHSNLTARCV